MNIYGYILPQVSERKGWIKIGQSKEHVEKRIKSQLSQAHLHYEILLDESALAGKRNITDREIHRYLEDQGFQRDGISEWFKCSVDDVKYALNFLKQKYINEDKRNELSDKFYEELRNWYYWATEEQYQGMFKREYDPDHALRIIVRLLLIFFLKEKRLVPTELFNENWIAENLEEDEHGYYNAVLRNLFFYSLNTPLNKRGELENRKLIKRYNKVKEQLHRRIPFLNGGLFNEHPGDDFALSNEYFFSSIKTVTIAALGGRYGVKGLINILKDYKYTLDETDDSECIDPEFIGKTFECLLACIEAETKESRRKVTGSYYTPREIVDYMINEALKAYLESSEYPTDENLLLRCAILDPACGSGAFPCGVMNAVMKWIDPKKMLTQSERYAKKLEILRNVIYGVDIQPMATQITILRLFLSMLLEMTPTEDAKNNFGIDPLPNLDYKFVVANTLMGINVKDLFFHEYQTEFSQLTRLKEDYFQEFDVAEKNKFRTRIGLLENELAKKSKNKHIKSLCEWNHSDISPSPYFDSRWMFGIDKFDIVIGNPPYLGEDDHKYIFELYKNSPLGRRFYRGKMDIFYFFFHAGLDFLKEQGILAFISTNYYLTADGADKLRADLHNRSEIIEIVNFNELKVFESALGQHNVITLLRHSKKPSNNVTKQSVTKRRGKATHDILKSILSGTDEATVYSTIPRKSLFDGKMKYIRFFVGNGIDSILDKIAKNGRSLGLLFSTNQGIVPGALIFSKDNALKYPNIKAEKNAPIFIFPKGMLHEICGIDSKTKVDYIKPFFKNSDIRRYVSETKATKELLYSDGREILPHEILLYLEKFKPILSKRRECKNGKIKWYELQWARTKSLFEKPKIVVPYRCKQATFAYNDVPFYAASDVYYITDNGNNTDKLKALLGILNSRLINLWLYHRGKRKGDVLELFSTSLRQIPIIMPKDIQPLVALVTRRLNGELVDDKIDALVYELYGLTDEERAIVEQTK